MNRSTWQTYSKKYGSMLAFLALELLLFTSLNLANYGMLFRYLAIVLALALLPLVFIRYKKEDWLNLALMFLLPLFMYAAFMAFSPLYFILQTVIDNIVMILALESFLFIGIALAQTNEFQIEKGLAAIFGGLGLLLTVSLVYTMWRYTPFYVLRYAGQVLYFDGERYLISEEAKWLFGFGFKEVKLSYFLQYAVMLSPLSLGLLFVDFKKVSKFDYVWMAAGLVGLLAIVLLPSFSSLLYLVPAAIIALLVKLYPRTTKAMKILTYGLWGALGIFTLASVFLVLFAFEVPFAVNLVTNSAVFAKVYGNPFVRAYAEVLQAAISHPFGGLHSIFVNSNFIETTHSSVFDTLYQGGIMATIGYLAVIVISGITLTRYVRFSKDRMHIKMLLVLFVATFFLYTAFDHEYAPFVREGERIYKKPFFSDLTLLLNVFLIGYAYARGQNQVPEQEKTEVAKG